MEPTPFRLFLKEQFAIALFFNAYFLGLVAHGVIAGRSQTAFYVVFVGAGAWLVTRIYARTRLSQLVLWGLTIWGLAHMIGGLVQISGEVIYEHSLGAGELRFDKFVHFFGFGFATLASFEVLRTTVAKDRPPTAVALTALFVGLGLGAINETIEFLITLLPGDSNVGGFSNTGWDLVANMLGALTASWAAPRLDRSDVDATTGGTS